MVILCLNYTTHPQSYALLHTLTRHYALLNSVKAAAYRFPVRKFERYADPHPDLWQLLQGTTRQCRHGVGGGVRHRGADLPQLPLLLDHRASRVHLARSRARLLRAQYRARRGLYRHLLPQRPAAGYQRARTDFRSEEHTSELQSLMRISYAVLCLKKNNHN